MEPDKNGFYFIESPKVSKGKKPRHLEKRFSARNGGSGSVPGSAGNTKRAGSVAAASGSGASGSNAHASKTTS